jgi:hypothetical protein
VRSEDGEKCQNMLAQPSGEYDVAGLYEAESLSRNTSMSSLALLSYANQDHHSTSSIGESHTSTTECNTSNSTVVDMEDNGKVRNNALWHDSAKADYPTFKDQGNCGV